MSVPDARDRGRAATAAPTTAILGASRRHRRQARATDRCATLAVVTERFVVVPAAYVYLLRGAEHAPEVLLQLRQGTGYMDGHWAAAAAGHVERGESVLDAAHRETAEELGVHDVELVFEQVMHRTGRALPIDERVDFFFSARRWSGEPTLMEPTKAAELGWFPLAALPGRTVPHEREVLTHLGRAPGLLTRGF